MFLNCGNLTGNGPPRSGRRSYKTLHENKSDNNGYHLVVNVLTVLERGRSQY